MNENKHRNKELEDLAKSAVAVVAATGVALGGAFGGEEEIGHDSGEGASIVEMLNPDTDETDDGLVEDEKQKKSGQRRVLRALAVGFPTAVLCWWGVAALCALLPAGWPAFLLTACKWVLTALAALLALSVTLKVAAPEEPIITSLHRTYKKTLLICLLLCCGEGALLWFFPAQAGHASQWLRLLAVTGVTVLLGLRAVKKEKEPEMREKTDRERILELADSVSGKKF